MTIDRLFDVYGFARLETAAQLDAFTARPGRAILFFTEDPARVRETLDLAVILPEVVRVHGPFDQVGVLLPALANERAAAYGVRRWPALVFLRDGGFLGAVEGLREWAQYVTLPREILAGPVCEPPRRVIPVAAAGRGC
jgi:hydrogenase-1 operon protein HyaE